MTNLNALLRAIIESPDDDTPRLAYADELEEMGTTSKECSKCHGSGKHKHLTVLGSGKRVLTSTSQPCGDCHGVGSFRDTSNHDRAEFIRVQCDIAKYPPRKKITDHGGVPVPLHHEFDDHYSFSAFLDMNLQYGDRVDIYEYRSTPWWPDNREEKGRWVYGLRVVKTIGEGAETRVIVRKDAESVRCPSDKLKKREKELSSGREVCLGLWFNPSPDDRVWHYYNKGTEPVSPMVFPFLVVSRGFVSEITCTAEDFLRHADALVWNRGQTIGGHWIGDNQQTPVDWAEEEPRPCPDTAQPIRKVVLTTTGPYSLGGVVQRPVEEYCKENFPGIEFEIRPESSQNPPRDLSDAINRARGGPAPIPRVGYG